MRTGILCTSCALTTLTFPSTVGTFSHRLHLVCRELHWAPHFLPVFFSAVTISTTSVWCSHLLLDTASPFHHLDRVDPNPQPPYWLYFCWFPSVLSTCHPSCNLPILSILAIVSLLRECVHVLWYCAWSLSLSSVCKIFKAVLAHYVNEQASLFFLTAAHVSAVLSIHFHLHSRPPLLQAWPLPRIPMHTLSPVLCFHHCTRFRRGNTCVPGPSPLCT